MPSRTAKLPKHPDAGIKPGSETGTWDVDVQIRTPQGGRWRRRATGLSSKMKARRVRDAFYSQYNLDILGVRPESSAVDVVAGEPRLHDWLDECVKNHWPASVPKTARLYATAVERWIKPHFPNRPLQELTGMQLRDTFDAMAAQMEGLAVNTLKNVKGALSSALTRAVERGHLITNPLQGIRFNWSKYESIRRALGRQPRKQVLLSRDEIKHILDTAEHNGSLYYPVMLLQALLGLRLGEALALERSDFDLDKGIVHVSKQIQRVPESGGGTRLATVPPKSDAGTRTIYIPDRVKRFVAGKDGLICAGRAGGHLEVDNAGARMSREIRDMGYPGFRSHDFRHSFISYLLNEARVPATTVKTIVGHSDIKTTLNYYSHASEGQLKAAMDAL